MMKIKIFISFLLFCAINFFLPCVYADTSTINGINYLKTNQDTTGKITGGSTGDASPWAAIAFSTNGIAISTIKNPTTSLEDYLLNNHPTKASAATEWEKWILAITAADLNPYSFGGIDYVSTLESSPYDNNNQIGDSASLNDDWFGILALISSGVPRSDSVLNNSLNFMLAHQNADGGYGYATTAGSDGNDTAAAIQALVAAKNYGMSNMQLDTAIGNAKTYLLSTQDKSGGFLYDANPWTTAPDSDSTTWALMALNVLGMQHASQSTNAKSWLLSQQSATNGGFMSCNQWDPNTFACTGYGANSTTTAHALIGLSGNGWLIKIFNTATLTLTPTLALTPSLTYTPTATPTATNTIIPTPTVTQSISNNTNTTPTIQSIPTTTSMPTAAPVEEVTTFPTAAPTQTGQHVAEVVVNLTDSPSRIPTAIQDVLGAKINNTLTKDASTSFTLQSFLAMFFLGMSILFAGFYCGRYFVKKVRISRN